MIFFGKPISTPDQVRGRLFPDHARPTMAQAESKKNARLPDETCGKICGAVMTSGEAAMTTGDKC
jgi:hypothetical protein